MACSLRHTSRLADQSPRYGTVRYGPPVVRVPATWGYHGYHESTKHTMLQGLVLYFYLPRIGTPPCKIRYVVCGMGVWVCALQWQSRAKWRIVPLQYWLSVPESQWQSRAKWRVVPLQYWLFVPESQWQSRGHVSYRAPPCKIRHIHPVCVLQGELSLFTRPPRAGTVRYVIYTQYIV